MTPDKQKKANELSAAIKWLKDKISGLEACNPEIIKQKDSASIQIATYPEGHQKLFELSLYDVENDRASDMIYKLMFKYGKKNPMPKIIDKIYAFQADVIKELKPVLKDLENQYKNL